MTRIMSHVPLSAYGPIKFLIHGLGGTRDTEDMTQLQEGYYIHIFTLLYQIASSLQIAKCDNILNRSFLVFLNDELSFVFCYSVY